MVNDGEKYRHRARRTQPHFCLSTTNRQSQRSNGITESNIVFAHALAGMVYKDMAAKKPQEVEALVYQTCQSGM
jgi:hypothetical protein